ncbi:MAG: hypothetical protein QOK40_3718 [Miltoncostaeaceae bacterium]|nr:hypothetical protein [Miltoncostaeaceae bacterium]
MTGAGPEGRPMPPAPGSSDDGLGPPSCVSVLCSARVWGT